MTISSQIINCNKSTAVYFTLKIKFNKKLLKSKTIFPKKEQFLQKLRTQLKQFTAQKKNKQNQYLPHSIIDLIRKSATGPMPWMTNTICSIGPSSPNYEFKN